MSDEYGTQSRLDRRTVLRIAGTMAAISVSGCADNDGADPQPQPDPNETVEENETSEGSHEDETDDEADRGANETG